MNILRHSNLVKTIDDTDSSILSNSTKYKMYQEVTPVTTRKKRTQLNLIMHCIIHTMITCQLYLLLTLKLMNDTTNEYFLDDDNSGNVVLCCRHN